MNIAKYSVILEWAGDAYGAYAPDIAGFGAAGRSLRQVKCLAMDGLASHLAETWRAGERWPRPSRTIKRPSDAVAIIEVRVDLDGLRATP